MCNNKIWTLFFLNSFFDLQVGQKLLELGGFAFGFGPFETAAVRGAGGRIGNQHPRHLGGPVSVFL